MKKLVLILFAISLLANPGCKKEEETISPETLSNIDDQILSSDLMDDVLDEVEYTLDIFWGELKAGFDDCRTVTVEPADRVTWPKIITIDFGTDGCLVRDSVVKKGKIIINQSAPQFGPAWTKIITFENYYVNDNQVQGTNTTTYSREGAKPTWTSTITGGQVTTPGGMIRTREAVHIRVQTQGTDTPLIRLDNAFLITGNAAGTRRDGKTFSWVITEPLAISNDCRWVRKGIKVLTLEGQSDITLNYGEGECNNIATISQGAISREIRLKGRRW